MAIKQTETLSRADFDEAMVRQRLNVSEVARDTGIPRTYLSEFRNGDRKLRPEMLAKLRDYFESKGVEFASSVLGRKCRLLSIRAGLRGTMSKLLPSQKGRRPSCHGLGRNRRHATSCNARRKRC